LSHEELSERGCGIYQRSWQTVCSFKGYEPCHNAQEVIERIGYDSERDVENPTGSVFCANGVSFLVSWDEVKNYMHVESYFQKKEDEENLNQTGLCIREKKR